MYCNNYSKHTATQSIKLSIIHNVYTVNTYTHLSVGSK